MTNSNVAGHSDQRLHSYAAMQHLNGIIRQIGVKRLPVMKIYTKKPADLQAFGVRFSLREAY